VTLTVMHECVMFCQFHMYIEIIYAIWTRRLLHFSLRWSNPETWI